jgi:hypothetical protein
MEDVVGLRVHARDGRLGAFITWGRVFDRVDPAETIVAVRKFMVSCGFPTDSDVHFCFSLTELSSFPYFYEGMLDFAAGMADPEFRSKKWMASKRGKLKAGREIYFLGMLDDRDVRKSVRFGRAAFAVTLSYSHPVSPLEEGWHNVDVEADLGSRFRAKFECATQLDAFVKFRDKMKLLHEQLTGSAELTFTEDEVRIKCTMERLGHVSWDIRLWKHSCGLGETNATLTFRLDDDQASLPGVIAELDELLDYAALRVEERKRNSVVNAPTE